MTSQDMVTKFVLRRDLWETPFGTFDYRSEAKARCEANDMDFALVSKHRVETPKIADVVKEIKAYLAPFAFESMDYITASSTVQYEQPNETLPTKYRWLIAFAVEGGSEGHYVHFGAMIQAESGFGLPTYQDFGFAKFFYPDEARKAATEIQRWLEAASWN